MSRSKRNAAAEDYLKRAPNYSGEAIESLLTRGEEKISQGFRGGHLLVNLAEMLASAHKFALPYGGKLFDETTMAAIEEWRLPFRCCAFEYAFVQEGIGVLTNAKAGSDKTIVLAVENPDGTATRLFPIIHSYANGWSVGLFAMEFRREAGVNVEMASIELTDLLWGKASPAAPKDLRERALRAVDYETRAVIQACAALACTNVTTEIIRPTREARAARPASTLFDYHVLMIDPWKERHPSEDRGGTHASPRTHLRRGHIRRLAWGARIWVNQCVVNPSAIGTVNKDYAVKGGKK